MPGDPPRPARHGVLRRRLGAGRSSPRSQAAPAPSTLSLVEGPAAVHRRRRRGVRHQGARRRQQRLAQRRAHHRRARASPRTTTPASARVTNIHRMADLVRGAVIPPGEPSRSTTTSASARPRRASSARAPSATACTSTRSAAACRSSPRPCSTPPTSPGSRSTSRRPTPSTSTATRGAARPRWAIPAPDLAFTNNTPYGIMIWTSYTDTSLTVTLYSTPYATGRADRDRGGHVGQLHGRHHHPHDHLPGRQDGVRTSSAPRYRPGEGQALLRDR